MPSPISDTALMAMISPAIFMTATGSLIISTSNRMARIADRIRQLDQQADELCQGKSALDFQGERQDHIASQVGKLLWRSDQIRSALSVLYLALALFVGTSLAIAIHVLIGCEVFALPTAMAMGGVVFLLAASVHLSREAHAALKANREEIEFYQELRRRRAARRA